MLVRWMGWLSLHAPGRDVAIAKTQLKPRQRFWERQCVHVGPSGAAKGRLDPFPLWSIPVSLRLMFSRCFVSRPHVETRWPGAKSCSALHATAGREAEGDVSSLRAWHLGYLKHI